MTLVSFSHDGIYATSSVKQGVFGGSINSADTSYAATGLRITPVQEEGTSAGQDDRLMGVSIGGTDGENGRLQTLWPLGLQTHGVASCIMDNNGSNGHSAGEILCAAVDADNEIHNSLEDTLANRVAATTDVGAALKITFSSIATITSAKHLALENEYARIIGYSLSLEAANTTNNYHIKVLMRPGVYTTYAV